MKTYNNEVVPKVKDLKPAQKAGRHGRPRRQAVRLPHHDGHRLPVAGQEEVPVFVWSNTGQDRASHHQYLFQLRGYVYVNMGHCFNPVTVHYWHFLNFTLDHWNGLACYTAAIAYLNKNADLYAMDTTTSA